MLEQCELRHGQLFFLIKVYEIYLRLNRTFSGNYLQREIDNIQHFFNFFEQLTELYLEYEKVLDEDGFSVDLNKQRRMLVSLQQKVNQGFMEIDFLKVLLWQENLNVHANKKIKKLTGQLAKLLELLSDIKSINAISSLDEKQKPFVKCLNKLNHIFLQLAFNEQYAEMLRIKEENVLLKNWKQKLVAFEKHLLTQTHSIYSREILIQEKLIADKNRFFQIFYAGVSEHRSDIETELLLSIDSKKDKKINDFLHSENSGLKQAINKIEQSLETQRYDVYYLAKLISLWKCTHYYLYASSFYNLAEESTQISFMQKIPLMDVKLWPETITFFTYLLGIILLSIDLYLARFTGISYVLISSITELLLLEAINHQSVFDSINLHSKAMYTAIIPGLKQSLNIGIYMLMHCFMMGISKENIGIALGAYLIGILFQKFFNSLIAKISNSYKLSSVSHQFLNLLNGYLSFGLGAQFGQALIHSVGYNFWGNPDKDNRDMIFNEQRCQSQRSLCCNHAKTILEENALEISEHSNKLESKSKWRHFLFSYHPDKTSDPDKQAIYHQVSAARQIIKFKCQK